MTGRSVFDDYSGKCKECETEYVFPLEDEKVYLCNSCLRKTYRKELVLDKNNLDEDAEGQHVKLEKWHSLWVEMKDVTLGIDQMVKEKAANLDGEIRSCSTEDLLDMYGIPKITESAVHGAVESHKDYIELIKLRREGVKRRDVLVGAVEAFRDRSSMVKVLKDLFVAQYFDRTRDVVKQKEEKVIAESVTVPKRRIMRRGA